MQNIKNNDGHLVAIFDEDTGTIIIARRGCETYIKHNKDGTITVVNVDSNAMTENH